MRAVTPLYIDRVGWGGDLPPTFEVREIGATLAVFETLEEAQAFIADAASAEPGELPPACRSIGGCALAATPEQAAQAQPAVEGWISVDERKPPMNTEVLIAFRDSTLAATGQYTGSAHDTWGWCFPSENDPEETGPITHWMELPPPPASQGKEDTPS